ncbi:MAG TPA: hypothetical protein VFV16_06635 [Candidatus Nitrosotalea sp.]|nr:hypothetical protein [Candidatus Nitrosotalea sp.]
MKISSQYQIEQAIASKDNKLASKRKLRRRLNYLNKKLSYGNYFLDCNNHPCIIKENNIYPYYPYDSYVVGKSLVSDNETSCSILHCGPEPIPKQKALEMVSCIKEKGWFQYLKDFLGYNDLAIEEYKKLNEIWDFTRNIPKEYL